MTLMIDLEPEVEQRLQQEASRQGISPDELARRLIATGLPAFDLASMPLKTPEERAAAFRAWADSLPPQPILSDEALRACPQTRYFHRHLRFSARRAVVRRTTRRVFQCPAKAVGRVFVHALSRESIYGERD